MGVRANNNKYKTAYFSLFLELSSCYLSTVQHKITISVKSMQPLQNPQQYKNHLGNNNLIDKNKHDAILSWKTAKQRISDHNSVILVHLQ